MGLVNTNAEVCSVRWFQVNAASVFGKNQKSSGLLNGISHFQRTCRLYLMKAYRYSFVERVIKLCIKVFPERHKDGGCAME